MLRLRHRRRWLWAAGALATLGVVSACQLIAGIDEKVSAIAGPFGPDATPDSPATNPPGSEGGGPIADTGPECNTHRECVGIHGENWVCVKPDRKCQPLLNDDCEIVLAGARNAPPAQKQEVLVDDNTIFFGFIMDLRGSGKNAGVARRQAVELAVGDIHTVSKGIPGGIGGARRPIAVVTCSETKDTTSAADPKVPAKHLIEDLHVPAIIGASNSDTTIDLFNGYAEAKATLVFSPNALSSALSSTSDNGLFWRTSATSILQGKAIQQQIGFVEQDILSRAGTDAGASAPLRLAIVYIADAFGTDIFPHVHDGLLFNGAPLDGVVNGPTCSTVPCTSQVLIEQYPANAQLDVLQEKAAHLAQFQPHIFVGIGRKDSVQISEALEEQTLSFLPTHLYTQGSATVDVTNLLTQNPNKNDVRARVRGTRPLSSPDENGVFIPLYNGAFPSGPPSGNGVPGCFDITYLLTYGALAAPGDATTPLTGARMNEGLKRVLDPKVAATNSIKVGTADLPSGMDFITGGHNIDVKGVSYIFDFDTTLGEAPGKVDIWCVSEAQNALKPSGEIFDPNLDGGATTGTYNCP